MWSVVQGLYFVFHKCASRLSALEQPHFLKEPVLAVVDESQEIRDIQLFAQLIVKRICKSFRERSRDHQS